jgi:SAM-dependent methyltransferase
MAVFGITGAYHLCWWGQFFACDGDRLLVAASAKGIGLAGVKQVKANTTRGMNPLLVNPFSDSATVTSYEAWYETTGRRADRLETALLEYLLADFPQAWSALEVGCGTGHFTRWSWEQGLRAVGLDLSSAMLTEAVRLASPPCVQGDALTLPFATGAFDLSVLVTTLEFVADPALALAEAMRVARYGLILGVLNRQSLMGWRLKRSGESLWQMAHFFTPAELTHLVQRAAAGKPLKTIWRTTLWPLWPAALPLPWGGFIGMKVKFRVGEHTDATTLIDEIK